MPRRFFGALRRSRIANGVAELHGETAREMWKGVPGAAKIISITIPMDKIGEVIGPKGKVINAMLPLGEMFGYATAMRSMSQGRATFTMEFDHYAEAPNNIAEAVIKKNA